MQATPAYDSLGNTNRLHDNHNRLSTCLVVSLVILSVFQQVPPIRDVFYGQIRVALYIGFGLAFILSVLTSLNSNTARIPHFLLFATWWSVLLDVGIALFVPTLLPSSVGVPAVMCFAMYFIGSTIKMRKVAMERFLLVFVVCALTAGAIIVLNDIGSFTILDSYTARSKNQVGPIIASASVIALWFALRKEQERFIFRAIMMLCFLVGLGTLMVIRNRAGIVALAVVFLLMLFRAWRRTQIGHRVVSAFGLAFLIFVLFLTGMIRPVITAFETSFGAGYHANSLDSLSAGRLGVYMDAIALVTESPIFGLIAKPDAFAGTPHNYLLNTVSSFGILLSIPLIWAYMRYWYFALKPTHRTSELPNSWSSDLSRALLLVSLTVSLFEYAAPYGPGSSQALVWLIAGYSGIFIRDNRRRPLLSPTNWQKSQ